MNKVIGFLAVGLLSTCVVGCSNMTKQDIGTVSGAAIGGLVGSRFGGGSGQVAATIGGAVIGGYLGSKIGKTMDENDQLKMQQTLETQKAGTTTTWRNPDSGTEYQMEPTKTYKNKKGQNCREYITTAKIGGKNEQVYGTACRQSDGSWKMIK